MLGETHQAPDSRELLAPYRFHSILLSQRRWRQAFGTTGRGFASDPGDVFPQWLPTADRSCWVALVESGTGEALSVHSTAKRQLARRGPFSTGARRKSDRFWRIEPEGRSEKRVRLLSSARSRPRLTSSG